MPYIIVGDKKGEIRALIYNPNVTHFKDDLRDTANWVITGTYQITDYGLRLFGNSYAISRDNVLDGKDNFVVIIPEKVNAAGNFTALAFTDENGNPTVELRWNRDTYTLEIYVQGNKVLGFSEDPARWERPLVVHKVGSMLMVWELLSVDLPADVPIKRIMFGTSGADVEFGGVGVYESAGTGVSSIRPIWTDRGVLKIGDHYYFVATRDYSPYASPVSIGKPSILKTTDMVNFEQHKHIWPSYPESSATMYAYNDGQYTHVWLLASAREAEFCIMKLDSDFNVTDVNRNVTINGLPEGALLQSIYFVNVRGKWWAVGSLTDGSVALFDTDGPWSPTLTYAKSLIKLDSAMFVTAHFVKDAQREYVLILSPSKWMLFDANFDNLVSSDSVPIYDPVLSIDLEALFMKDKFFYASYSSPVWL
jgi:hypothetical protein